MAQPASDAVNREVTGKRRRCVIVGLGSRAELYTRALAGTYRDQFELVGFCDTNHTRMALHNRWLAEEFGHSPVVSYPARRFRSMLVDQGADTVVVTSVDSTHDEYIVGALESGCSVVCEKPMTTDARRCARILETQRRTGGSVAVTFNYRYNPTHERVRELLAEGAIGRVTSVNFEWLLDTRHGADYFRRWHRDKASSGGLLVHKSSHHFDLVNWWLDDEPERVFALGGLSFYGRENGLRSGHARDYVRASGSADAEDDPFALRLENSPRLRGLYRESEHEDGYHRDRNVFAPDITIEDDMSVLVAYRGGARLTYQLVAYSPREGYRVVFNGTQGRLELHVRENQFARPGNGDDVVLGLRPGSKDPAAETNARITVQRLWQPEETVLDGPIGDGHGGGDERMLAELFAADPGGPRSVSHRAADHLAGARSLVIGLAANQSIGTGAPVFVHDVLEIS